MPDSSNPPAALHHRHGPPWGLAIAVGLLLVLEGVLRLANPRGVLPASLDRELAYRAVVPELLGFGAPDVAIVGSSRARRAVLSPRLRAALAVGGSRPTVGNFALGGAEAEEMEGAVRRLLEANPRPSLLVWALSPREFEPRSRRPARQTAYLWRIPDWARARKAIGSDADAFLPDAVRNEAARHSFVVRYRFAMRDLLEDPPKRVGHAIRAVFTGKRGETTLHGGIDGKLRGKGKNSVLAFDRARVEEFIGDAYAAPDWPKNYQGEHFRAALGAARSAGVPLLVVELPLHPVLVSALPPGTIERYRSFVAEAARQNGASFVTTDRLDLDLELTDFHEHSHVNLRGAEKYTAALAPIVRARLGKAERTRKGREETSLR
jgi:hypothetical protein